MHKQWRSYRQVTQYHGFSGDGDFRVWIFKRLIAIFGSTKNRCINNKDARYKLNNKMVNKSILAGALLQSPL